MAKGSYNIGRMLGKNWKLVALVGVLIGGAAIYKPSAQPRVEAPAPLVTETPADAARKAIAAREAGKKLAEDALTAKCNAGAKDLKQKSDALVKAGNPVGAMIVLRDCSKATVEPSNRALLDAAYKTAQLQDEANVRKGVAAEKARKKSEGVRVGMSQEEVLASQWGKPRKINRTTNASAVSEQWVYDGGYLYFRDGVLQTVQN